MILFIKNELSYDKFNKNAASIYRVAFSDYLNMGGFATTPIPIGPALKQQMPEVQAMTRFCSQDPYLMKYADKEYFEPFSFADEDVFKTDHKSKISLLWVHGEDKNLCDE